MRVAVVGAGVMGAATARALAAGGDEVVLLEQFAFGHARGSSHGTSRIFRLSYAEPSSVRMAQEALPLWRALEVEAGERLLRLHGGLDLGGAAAQHAAALGACDAAYEWLTPAQARAQFPMIALPREPVLFHPDAGIVLADRAWAALVRGAVRRGCVVREHTLVGALVERPEAVEVHTSGGVLHADVAVVTAGAWAPGLLDRTGIELSVVVTRETVAYFGPGRQQVLPSVVEWQATPLYALSAPGRGVKAGEHHAGVVADPTESGSPDDASVARVVEWVRERLPGVDPEPVAVETCLYTTTRDHSFVLRRHGRVVVGSPCSGHGFKFAPLIGARLAALARAEQESSPGAANNP